jgi:hypothetical protein
MSERKRMARASLDTSRTEASAMPVTPRDSDAEADVTAAADLSTYLERARVRLGVQIKEIAFHWKTDHGYVSRVLANAVPLPDHRLAQLPKKLQRATLEEWARDLDVTVGRKADLARAVEALVRLATDETGDATLRPTARLAALLRRRLAGCPRDGHPRHWWRAR